jgi:uncharacterized damage-inducible protein DinB
MPINLNLDVLLDYTDWERQEWFEFLSQQGDSVLKVSVGPHSGSRFSTVGDLIKHLFSAEKRYIERLSGRKLTDAATIPNDNIETLFEFGRQSRKELREFVETFPDGELDVPADHKILDHVIRLTPRKIVVHVVMHEIRHWAQIATLLRLNDLAAKPHDFLFSPLMGGMPTGK